MFNAQMLKPICLRNIENASINMIFFITLRKTNAGMNLSSHKIGKMDRFFFHGMMQILKMKILLSTLLLRAAYSNLTCAHWISPELIPKMDIKNEARRTRQTKRGCINLFHSVNENDRLTPQKIRNSLQATGLAPFSIPWNKKQRLHIL